jgi:TPR repeat protein
MQSRIGAKKPPVIGIFLPLDGTRGDHFASNPRSRPSDKGPFAPALREAVIQTGLRLLIICLLAICEIAASASGHELAAETERHTVVTSMLPTIEKLLSENRTASRDEQLYAAALALFKAIEAGQQPAQGRELLARALHEVAAGGHTNAWIDYGRCLWNGWGVSEDREKALAAYRRGADLGSDYAAYLAAYNLYWTFGRYDEAYAYASRALAGDDPDGAVRYLLGIMAYHGRGRSKDVAESLRLHLEASQRGNADAYFELFVYAMQGIGDRSKAVAYLKEAGRRNQPRACANLGALFATGQMPGIGKDLTEAVRWYKRAADLGVARAAAALGVMAIRGEGMARDPEAAEAFLKRAEDSGFDVDEYLQANGPTVRLG